jgi:kynurenine formamidase
MPSRIIELAHPIQAGQGGYPGLPAPEAEVILDYDASRTRYGGPAEFFIASLRLCGNTGTYVDAPVHRHRGGLDLAGLPLERLAHLPVRSIDVRAAGRAVGPAPFARDDLAGAAVLVRTDWSTRWGSDAYFQGHPFLTAAAARRLADTGAAFVGIDTLNIDDTTDPSRPAHTVLLAAGIPICEHMTNLAALPAEGGRLHAVPIAWQGGASFPVRAYVVVD